MKTNDHQRERLQAHVAELEQLVAKWEHVSHPEAKWMLYLLREALEMGRQQLSGDEFGDFECP